jgi:hypothetical protein
MCLLSGFHGFKGDFQLMQFCHGCMLRQASVRELCGSAPLWTCSQSTRQDSEQDPGPGSGRELITDWRTWQMNEDSPNFYNLDSCIPWFHNFPCWFHMQLLVRVSSKVTSHVAQVPSMATHRTASHVVQRALTYSDERGQAMIVQAGMVEVPSGWGGWTSTMVTMVAWNMLHGWTNPVDCFDHALPQALLHGHGENSLVKVATGRYGSFVVEPWPAAFCRGILEAAWSLDTLVGAPVSTYYWSNSLFRKLFWHIFNFILIGTVEQRSANGGTSLTDPNCSAVESPRRLWPGATWAVAQLGSHSQSSLGSWAAGIGELCLWKALKLASDMDDMVGLAYLMHIWYQGFVESNELFTHWNVGRKFAAFLTRVHWNMRRVAENFEQLGCNQREDLWKQMSNWGFSRCRKSYGFSGWCAAAYLGLS